MGRFGFGGFGNISAKVNAASKAATSKAMAAIESAKQKSQAAEFDKQASMDAAMHEHAEAAAVAASKNIENAQFSEEWASVIKSPN